MNNGLPKSAPKSAKFAWSFILVMALLLATNAYADGGEAGTGSGGGMIIIAAFAAMILLGSPLFVIISVIAVLCFYLYGDSYLIEPCLTLDTASGSEVCRFDAVPAQMGDLAKKNVLLAIPFFVVSGALMSAGDIANRLIGLARAMCGFLPGGLAVATVGGCVFFAAISGSSPVTVIAIGTIMYPALVKAQYPEQFSLGLVTTAGSLGILIPPSIPMLVFAIVAGGSVPIPVNELFMAGMLPGFAIAFLLAAYSIAKSSKSALEFFKGVGMLAGVIAAGVAVLALTNVITPGWGPLVGSVVGLYAIVFWLRPDSFWAVTLPVLILVGIYTGIFTATEAAAVSVIYAAVVELFIHRQLKLQEIPKVLADSAVMLGTILIIMAVAFSLNMFLVEKQVPEAAVELLVGMDLSAVEFLLLVNLLLLVVGALMESISAILILAPLITPVATEFGIDPIHLAIIFIVNLEIGYLTPPIGINLFVASAAFNRPLGAVVRSVVPYILIMLVGLVAVTYVPTIALGPVNVAMRGEPFYEPFPDGTPQDEQQEAEAAAEAAGAQVELAGGRTIADIQKFATDLNGLCFAAEDVIDDEDIAPADRVEAWKKAWMDQDIEDKDVLALGTAAAASAGTPASYEKLRTDASTMLSAPWSCDALVTLLGPADAKPATGDAKAPADDEADDEAAPDDDAKAPTDAPEGKAEGKAAPDEADSAD